MITAQPKPARPRQYSIRRSVIRFLVLGAVLLCILFTVGIGLDRWQARLHAAFVDRTIQVGDIPITLDEMETLLNEYIRTWSQSHLTSYKDKTRLLRTQIAAAELLSRDTQSSQDYLRRIDAFNQYQDDILAAAHADRIANYAPLAYVRMALGRQKIQAQEMAHSDLLRNRAGYLRELARIQSIRIGLWAVSILLVLAVGIYAFRSLGRVSSAMALVHDNLQALSRQEWDAPDLEKFPYLELDEIGGTANQMKHVIRDAIRRVEDHAKLERQLVHERFENERTERMLTEARLSALRSQVNPHFLFNTLNLIGKSAFLQEPELAMELIEAIAKILRYSLDSGSRTVTVQEEIDIAATYLYLQKSRFGEAVSYTVQVDEDLWNTPVQPMIIQPLVENCFKHGMQGKRSLAIAIQVHRVGDHMDIAVRDNGSGFSDSANSKGTGLENIRHRLQLEYGNGTPLRIDSPNGGPTTVTVSIPFNATGKNT